MYPMWEWASISAGMTVFPARSTRAAPAGASGKDEEVFSSCSAPQRQEWMAFPGGHGALAVQRIVPAFVAYTPRVHDEERHFHELSATGDARGRSGGRGPAGGRRRAGLQ